MYLQMFYIATTEATLENTKLLNYTTPCYVSVSLDQRWVSQGHHCSTTSSHRDHSSNEDCHCSSFYNAQRHNSPKLLSSNKWQHM